VRIGDLVEHDDEAVGGSSEMSIGASGRASSRTPWWTASRGRRWAISSADATRVSTPRAAISAARRSAAAGVT
jgi:hypothetical protein